MSLDTIDETQDIPEEGAPLVHAWGLKVKQGPELALRSQLRELDEDLTELENRAVSSKATDSIKRAEKLRKTYKSLEKDVEKNISSKKVKDGEKTSKKIYECYLEVAAEMYVPAREMGLAKALSSLISHRGSDDKFVKKFTKDAKKISKKDKAKDRCDAYFALERDVIKIDLVSREDENPGSTWQTHLDYAIDDAEPSGRIVGGIKKAFKKVPGFHDKPIPEGEYAALKKAFVNWCRKKAEDMSFGIEKDKRDEFLKQATISTGRIADTVFHPSEIPKNRQESGALLMKANTQALIVLTDLKRAYPPDKTPQVFVGEDGKISIMKPAPKVESLVLQGGGGKGIGYPPLFEEMEKTGMLKEVDLLVGTSIGALNASCMACGGRTKDQQSILELGLFSEAWDSKKLKKKYPDVSFGKGSLGGLVPTCAGQMAKMDEMTARLVADGVKSYTKDGLKDTLVEKLRALDDATLERLGMKGYDDRKLEDAAQKLVNRVKNQDFGTDDRSGQMITFRDLAILHQLDPGNFKELTITGWEGEGDEGHTVYFNAKDFPDMPVAIAARISMGLPVFSPVYWNGRGPFYDGGLGSNSPLEAAPGLDKVYSEKTPQELETDLQDQDPPLELQKAMAGTMLMTFDEGGEAHKKLHGDTRFTKTPAFAEKTTLMGGTGSSVLGFNTLSPNYDDTLLDDSSKAYNSGVNTVPVYHGGQGTMSLGPMGGNQEAKDYAENLSRMKALEHIESRTDQAVMMSVGSVDEALHAMDPSEMRALIKQGKPEKPEALVELFEKCQQYGVIDDAFRQVQGGGDASTFLEILAKSPLCESCTSDVEHLRDQYNVCFDDRVTPEALRKGAQNLADTIKKCPAFLQQMLTKVVLIPVQQLVRGLSSEEEDTGTGSKGNPRKAAQLLGIEEREVNVLMNLLNSKKLAKDGFNQGDINRAAKEINLRLEAEAIMKALEEAGLI
ncbi:Patatin-like phospholipase [Maioricimonas rarisocia]|uniref:Patatin-like phospholipase n=1 Tax=Maioricimonas rarisocia TaxID=2528026 RepID=A0A517ZFG1_9PLAN|nr:patatin-like phospholipase family protein [Maioricimonas rarisocia]QDU41227.1 Patatin-like phospholipase [Maioricimonas rarisocia]